jgi:hypothetical protein
LNKFLSVCSGSNGETIFYIVSRRWPLQVSFSIPDVAAINALILYEEVTGNKISRHFFLSGQMNFLGLYCAKEISSVHLHQVPSIDSVKLLHGNKLKLKTLALKKNLLVVLVK